MDFSVVADGLCRPVLCFSLAVSVVGLGACERPIARPNAPEPPVVTERYAGRVVLRTAMLRDRVADFAEVWHRRLAILSLTGRITFDDDAAVFDLYDVLPSELPAVVRVLVDRGGFVLRTASGQFVSLDDGQVTHWKLPTPDCHCAGTVRVSYPAHTLRLLASAAGTLSVLRDGVPTGWRIPSARIEWRTDDRGERTPVAVEFTLPEGNEARAMVLALGGGRLPQIPRIERIVPAGR